jgi:hypothetical protein
MYPNEQSYMLNDSVNIEKHIKNISAENMRNYRKRKAQENRTPQASTSTDRAPTPIIYNCNQANKHFQKNVIGNPFVYACDICRRLLWFVWYINYLKQVKENTQVH